MQGTVTEWHDHHIKCALCLAVRVEVHDFPQECDAAEVCVRCFEVLARLDAQARTVRRRADAVAAMLREFGLTTQQAGQALAQLGAAAA